MMEKEKWIESVKSIGSIYKDVFNELEKEGREHLMGKVMFEKGLKAGKRLVKKKGSLGSLKEITKALIKLYKTCNIQASVRKKGKEKAILSIKNCEWGKLQGWNARHCASIEQFERELIEGINVRYAHKCPGRKSLGQENCKVIVELKKK